MILTLTPNPAVDRTIFVHHLDVGEVNRFHESQFDPAGKGVNLSRMVRRLGWPTVAFGFLGGETVGSGDSLAAGLAVALAHGDDLTVGLRLGAAVGAATAMTPGAGLGTAGAAARLMPQVRIETIVELAAR